jgi:HEAT repeat protein
MPDNDDTTSRGDGAGGFDDHGELDAGLDDEPGDNEARATPDQVIAAIVDEANAIPFHDLPALSEADNATAGKLLNMWPKIQPARRREVLATLQRLGEEDSTLDFDRVHLTALQDPDPATRILAIRGLWEQEREDVMRLLVTTLRADPEASVRGEAANVLGQYVVSMEFGMIPEDAAEFLSEALRDTVEDGAEEEEVRARALESLGASSEEWVAEMIAEYYESGTSRMRLATIRAMGRNASDDWLPVLIYNFDDDDAETRAAAATSAGQLLLDAAVEPLAALTEDTDDEVQIAAVNALGEIAGEAAEAVLTRLLDREPWLADAARHALAEARLIALDDAEDDESDERG